MRYVIYGAGAIGGGVGGLLARAGVPATLVARGAHLAALRAHGLDLQVGHERATVAVDVVGSAGEVEWTDDTVVLLGVKGQQTAVAVDDLLATMPVTTPVVSLQNGVANERALLRRVPHVYGVCVMMPASHLEPGRVVVHSAGTPGLLDVGRFPDGPGSVDDVARTVAADLRRAGFASEARADIMAWKYRKLLMNLGNAVGAACRPGDDADTLTELAQDEGERVLAAAGVDVVSAEADAVRRGELLRPLVDRDGVGGSTWQSVRRGTGDVEVDYLSGEIVLLGRLHRVDTPVNELIRRHLLELVRDGGEAASTDAGDLLRLLEA